MIKYGQLPLQQKHCGDRGSNYLMIIRTEVEILRYKTNMKMEKRIYQENMNLAI
jgi:hypothetical protein